MQKVALLIPASPNRAFFSQIAAFSAAIDALPWKRWQPSIFVCLGGEPDVAALQAWRPYLRNVALHFIPASVADAHTFFYGQIDSLYRWAPRDADVLVRLDADVLPVAGFEDVLDYVQSRRVIAGVMAHYAFPHASELNGRQAWLQVSQGLISKPLDFRLAYSLVGPDAAEDDRVAPFYLNDGVVFFPRALFDEYAEHYLAIRPKLMDRLTAPYFAGQIALSLAITEMGATTCALPPRYNFANDESLAARYPEELQSVCIFHYLRTDVFDRQLIFAGADAWERFMTADLDGANAVFRQHVRRIFGREFPFPTEDVAGMPERPFTPASPLAKNNRILSRDAYNTAVSRHSETVQAEIATIDAELASADITATRRTFLQTRRCILQSGLFDAGYYLDRNLDVKHAGVEALSHYINWGDREGRPPNEFFRPAFYRRRAMLPAGQDGNALQHYCEHGERDGKKPCMVFDPAEYLAAHPGLAEFVDRPLFHFLNIGRHAGYRPHPLLAEAKAAIEMAERFESTGSLEHLMKTKQALVAVFSANDAFAIYRDLLTLPDSDHVNVRRLEGLRDFAARDGLVFVENSPAHRPFTIPAPRIVGEADAHPHRHESRSIYVACLADVRVRGRSAVIETGNAALLDYEDWESRLFDCELDIDPAIFHANAHEAWVPAPAGEKSRIELDEAFFLLGPQTGAFGDWMYQSLPRFVAADMSGVMPAVPVLVDQGLPATILQSLQAVLRPGMQIIEVPPYATVSVRKLWCAPSLHYAPAREIMNGKYKFDYSCPDPAVFLPVVRETCRRTVAAGIGAQRHERVYLARKPSLWRKLVNHEEVEAVMRARGFAIVYPEELAFADQVAVVHHAKFVVAPEGSAVMLAYYARPGLNLCLINHPIVDTCTYDGLLDGVNLTVFVGPIVHRDPHFPHRSDYRIDAGAFSGFLDDWLGENA